MSEEQVHNVTELPQEKKKFSFNKKIATRVAVGAAVAVTLVAVLKSKAASDSLDESGNDETQPAA